MFYIALSSLQGKSQIEAYDQIIKLNPEGIQLTPGNKVDENFKEHITIPYRLHHCFSWIKPRRNLYGQDAKPINVEYNQSIHPPMLKDFPNLNFKNWIENLDDYILEVMYPDYYGGNDEQINQILDLKFRIAVDISHLYILKCKEAITDSTLNRILNYDRVEEVHVSHNKGRADTHQPINVNTPFLSWVKERKDLAIVYESYFHRLDFNQRLEQINIVKDLLC